MKRIDIVFEKQKGRRGWEGRGGFYSFGGTGRLCCLSESAAVFGAAWAGAQCHQASNSAVRTSRYVRETPFLSSLAFPPPLMQQTKSSDARPAGPQQPNPSSNATEPTGPASLAAPWPQLARRSSQQEQGGH